MLSASANKLSKLKEQAAEYASLIMEELDPENLGYIEVTIKSLTPFIKKSIKFSIFKLEGMLPSAGKEGNPNSSNTSLDSI